MDERSGVLTQIAAVIALLLLAACSGNSSQPEGQGTPAPTGTGGLQINGAGATFPNPIYSKWFVEYERLHPEVRINYQPIGSGGGIRQLSSRTVFFGASDVPMTEEQVKGAPGPILHFPTTIGAVVPIYNLEGSPDLKLTGDVLANIYLGRIRRWNDASIIKLNPGVPLPAIDIAVVHRSEASGTTFIFLDYLAKVSPAFQKAVGVSASVAWPAGIGGKGNEGVTALVSQSPGGIGYVELVYALQNKISYAAVQNPAGEFVKGSPDSVTKAAAGATVPDDFRVSITNAPGGGAYPISSFTWLLLYQEPTDKAQGKAMSDFLRWALTDGQKFATGLGYAPLPQNVVTRELDALARIKVE
jgi:phosphate transport system substrate-binding protein